MKYLYYPQILIIGLFLSCLSTSLYGELTSEAVSYFNQAQKAYAKGQYDVALRNYLLAYNNGDDILSPTLIADIYLKGQHNGVPNTTEGVKWLQIAAKNDTYGRVQCDLATYYYQGIGVSRDLNKAFYYYSLSANNGFTEAMYYLGLAYEEGEGTIIDIDKAIYWYKKAAIDGHGGAANNLSRIYGMSKYGIMDIKESGKWAMIGAEAGDRSAQTTVGLWYLNGFGFEKDINKAIYWLKKAAEQGSVQAQIELAKLGY